MRIGFFGTPNLAATVLTDIIAHAHIEVAFVVTNPDKPTGRDQHLTKTPVREVAEHAHIPVYTPTKIRENHTFLDEIDQYQCDYFIVVAYGKILPQVLLDMPKKMCINIHGSLLPKYRGASPIQSALLAGDDETGVTIMKMSEGMDEGDILKIRTLTVDRTETAGTLFEKFANISGDTLIQTLFELEMGGITPLPQKHTDATYCKKIEKENGLIPWSKSAKTIYHMWQGYTPWPGIYTIYEGKRLLLEKVGYIPNTTGSHYGEGTVVKLEGNSIGIQCGEGLLTLDQVKLEGKKSQSIKDFMNGNQNFINTYFS